MTRNVNLRVSLQDGELVKRALLALGPAGEEAFNRIARGSKTASVGLKAVDATVRETRGSLEGLAARGGAAGSILTSLGPAGLAGAAGLGAIVIGIGAVMSRAREAVAEFDALEDSARRLGVGTEYLQGLRFAVGQAGGDIEKTEAALDKLNAVMGDVARGGGADAQKAFKALGVSVTDADGKVKSLERVLPELADGFQKLGSESERASVAQDLFGRGNQAFARVLADGADGLRRQIDLAREMGAVVDADLVRKGAEAKDKLEALAMVVDAQLNAAVVDAAPLIIKLGEAFAGLAHWLGMTADAWKDLDDQRIATLTSTLGKLEEQLVSLKQAREGIEVTPFNLGLAMIGVDDPSGAEGMDRQIADLEKRIAAYRAAIERQRELGFELRRGQGLTGGGPQGLEGFSQAIQDTIDKLKEQEEQARRTGRELAVYNALLGHESATEAERVAIAEQAIRTFEAQEEQRRREAKAREEVAEAKRKENEAERDLQRTMREGERLTEQVATAEEKRAAKLREINELLAANAINEETAARARQQVEDDYLDDRTDAGAGFARGFKEIQKDAADAAQAAETLLTNAFSNAEDAFVEFARTGKLSFSSLIDGMIADLARLAFRAAVSGIFDLMASGIGGGLGGGAAPANLASPAGGMGLSFGGLYADGGWLGAGKWGIAGEAGPEIVRGPAMIEPILPRAGGRQIVNVNVYNQAPGIQVETKEERRNDGRLDLAVVVKAVNQVITEGRADGAMRGRFGVQPARTPR